MNNKQYTNAIVLSRIDFGETDRVITLLTPNLGKLHILAKGVRKEKSRLAGGIELFSEVEVGFINGRGELGTLISARLIKFYDNILKDIDKVQLMYRILKDFDKTTEDNLESGYYDLLLKFLALANESTIDYLPLSLLYRAQLLSLHGHLPNLLSDTDNKSLSQEASYDFELDSMCFKAATKGRYKAEHLKYLRLLFADPPDNRIFKLQNTQKIASDLEPLIEAMMKSVLSI